MDKTGDKSVSYVFLRSPLFSLACFAFSPHLSPRLSPRISPPVALSGFLPGASYLVNFVLLPDSHPLYSFTLLLLHSFTCGLWPSLLISLEHLALSASTLILLWITCFSPHEKLQSSDFFTTLASLFLALCILYSTLYMSHRGPPSPFFGLVLCLALCHCDLSA